MKNNNLAKVIRETAEELALLSNQNTTQIVIKLLHVDIFSEIKDNPSWQDIGILFNISKGRARQIDYTARKKIQKYSKQTRMLQEHIEDIDNMQPINKNKQGEIDGL
jgi:DNA-directed RNA polymerase sigma subunit (sigma70/sigma32)